MSASSPQGDLRERIVIAVRAAHKPVSLKAISKLVKVNVLSSDLDAAVANSQVFIWPKSRGPENFWHTDQNKMAREAILSATSASALSKSDLNRKIAKIVPGFPAKKIEAIASSLLSENLLQAVPALFGTSKLLMKSGCAEAYFNMARLFLTAKITKAGFDPEDFFKQHSSSSDEAAKLILDAVQSLEPVRGVPVSTLRLRNHLRHLTKQEFDHAALELRKKQQVFLSQHADPNNISQEDKNLLIDGQDGTYYVAVAIR